VVSICTTWCDIQSICSLSTHTVFRFPYKFHIKQQMFLPSLPPPHTQIIVQMNFNLPKVKYLSVFYSRSVCSLLYGYLQGSFHILVQFQKFLIAAMFLIVSHTQHLVSNADSMQAEVYNLSPLLNFIFQSKISYRNQLPLLLLRSTKYGHNWRCAFLGSPSTSSP
jgi:hypothetical protein